MYIAAAYKCFISWQNGFLKPICDANKEGGILQFYTENIKNKIPIQDAKENNILSFENINYKNIIFKNWKRDILIFLLYL